LTVEQAQGALDQVRQQLAHLPTQQRDLQRQLHESLARIRDLERRVNTEPGLDATLAVKARANGQGEAGP
jgi:chromosome segregation ATPase